MHVPRTDRSLRRWQLLAVLLASIALVVSLTSPAAADSWTLYDYGWASEATSTINPTMLEFYNPATLEIRKEDSLLSGEPAANICLTPGGNPAFQASTNPAWNNVGYEFGSAWALVQDSYYYGDTLNHDPSGSDTVYDTDGDGNPGPMEGYVLSFNQGYIVGRSLTITFSYGLVYNGGSGCQTDNFVSYGNVGS